MVPSWELSKVSDSMFTETKIFVLLGHLNLRYDQFIQNVSPQICPWKPLLQPLNPSSGPLPWQPYPGPLAQTVPTGRYEAPTVLRLSAECSMLGLSNLDPPSTNRLYKLVQKYLHSCVFPAQNH